MISKNMYHNVIHYNMILYRVWKWHCRISIRLWTHNGQAMECLLMVWYLGWKWFSSQGLTVITLMCETMRMHIIIYKYVYLLGIKDVALHFMQIFAKPTTRLEVHHCFVFGLVIGHFHCTILKKEQSLWLATCPGQKDFNWLWSKSGSGCLETKCEYHGWYGYQWFGARLQYLHCLCTEDTAVLYKDIDILTGILVKGWTILWCVQCTNQRINAK